jgi:hypothetical protein
VLIRADTGGGTHEFTNWLHARKLGYSLGFGLPDNAVTRLAQIPADAWTPAYDDERTPRDGAWVAEATGMLDLSTLAARDADHRAQGRDLTRRAATIHRHRRQPPDRLRHHIVGGIDQQSAEHRICIARRTFVSGGSGRAPLAGRGVNTATELAATSSSISLSHSASIHALVLVPPWSSRLSSCS